MTLDTTSMALCAPTTGNSAPPTGSPDLDSIEGPKKRHAPSGEAPPHKVTKRRAARACVSCRARKVRCDVVEGAPCGNCRWDNVECIVQESRRRKHWLAAWELELAQALRHNCAADPATSRLLLPPTLCQMETVAAPDARAVFQP
ncbi:hypothetical protein CDD82_5995 [Ophiocordyceps australis]|uniref:Zn(2)-C6 fungal-type domain-containing protein n=1 Tax=Ophiocordyceps australis TaxID=1399860 RepID=A0A2C5YXM8_9HYPO|nr:hypothetical protein CDD82_5995 [Ophiocordyceps australis]